jgi:hypothetical protein
MQPLDISVYMIASARDLLRSQTEIERSILSATDMEFATFVSRKHDFSIDAVSGWIRYNLLVDLWNPNPKRAVPSTEAGAVSAATKFLRRLREECAATAYRKLNLPPIIPAEEEAILQLLSVYPVNDLSDRWIDHWLCRYAIKLKGRVQINHEGRLAAAPVILHPVPAPARKGEVKGRGMDDQFEATVSGATIDIRIGNRSKVVGFVSQWRPAWLNRPLSSQMLVPNESENQHLSLVYLAAGENSPQTFLAPYYLLDHGEHSEHVPASAHSITVLMVFSDSSKNGTVEVSALIIGGSGEYIYNWGYWQPDSYFNQGLIQLGSLRSIFLQPGAYNIILHVLDTATGVIVLCERMAFVPDLSPFANPRLST